MAEHICSNCNKKIGFGREKLLLINKNEEELLFCSECYKLIPKEEKLKLTPTSNKGGKLNVGYAFGLAGGAGFAAAQNESIMNPIKQYNLKLDEINKYAIMNFDRHFLLAKNELKAGIMSQMAKSLKKEKLDELAKQHYFNEYEMLDKRDKKPVKNEWKIFTKENKKKNKHLKDLKTFLEKEES